MFDIISIFLSIHNHATKCMSLGNSFFSLWYSWSVPVVIANDMCVCVKPAPYLILTKHHSYYKRVNTIVTVRGGQLKSQDIIVLYIIHCCVKEFSNHLRTYLLYVISPDFGPLLGPLASWSFTFFVTGCYTCPSLAETARQHNNINNFALMHCFCLSWCRLWKHLI
jgi:hypothetical protein